VFTERAYTTPELKARTNTILRFDDAAEARALLMRFLLGYATGELRACGVSEEELHICFGAALLAFPKPLERPS
jgi:hypothetical protein